MEGFPQWVQGLITNEDILRHAQAYSARLHNAFTLYFENKMTRYDLWRTYYECVQVKGLLNMARGYNGPQRLAMTVCPTLGRVVRSLPDGFLEQAEVIFEKEGFDYMKQWMLIQMNL